MEFAARSRKGKVEPRSIGRPMRAVIVGIRHLQAVARIFLQSGSHHQPAALQFYDLRFPVRFPVGERGDRLTVRRRNFAPDIRAVFVVGITNVRGLTLYVRLDGRRPSAVGKNGGTVRGRICQPPDRLSESEIFHRTLAVGVFHLHRIRSLSAAPDQSHSFPKLSSNSLGSVSRMLSSSTSKMKYSSDQVLPSSSL